MVGMHDSYDFKVFFPLLAFHNNGQILQKRICSNKNKFQFLKEDLFRTAFVADGSKEKVTKVVSL